MADLTYLRDTGFADEIKKLAAQGTPVIGVCGGNQMLGKTIYDPHHMEGDIEEIEGLGLVVFFYDYEGSKNNTSSRIQCFKSSIFKWYIYR